MRDKNPFVQTYFRNEKVTAPLKRLLGRWLYACLNDFRNEKVTAPLKRTAVDVIT